jgi:BclB C-terminal domain-containing protein
VTLTTVAEGVGTDAAVGFGNSTSGITPVAGVIDSTAISNFAYSMPRNGTLTDMAAFFSTTAAIDLTGTTVTITAQVWTSPAPNDAFTPVAGAIVTLAPALTGTVATGDVSSGLTTGLSVPLTAGTRVLVIFSSTATGTTLVTTVVGFASAGLNIE